MRDPAEIRRQAPLLLEQHIDHAIDEACENRRWPIRLMVAVAPYVDAVIEKYARAGWKIRRDENCFCPTYCDIIIEEP